MKEIRVVVLDDGFQVHVNTDGKTTSAGLETVDHVVCYVAKELWFPISDADMARAAILVDEEVVPAEVEPVVAPSPEAPVQEIAPAPEATQEAPVIEVNEPVSGEVKE